MMSSYIIMNVIITIIIVSSKMLICGLFLFHLLMTISPDVNVVCSDVVLESWSWSRGASTTLFVVLVLVSVLRLVVLFLVLVSHNGLVYM